MNPGPGFGVLFVCMGNICRSPSAEGFFARALKQSAARERVSIDSAGTHGYHVGHAPDPRAVAAAADFGVDIGHLRARRVGVDDFHRFDLLLAMDFGNLEDLHRMRPPDSKAELALMMQYHRDAGGGKVPEEVPDPYYGGEAGFVYMCELLESATAGLLEHLERRLGGR